MAPGPRLAFVLARRKAWQHPLFDVVAAWAQLALSQHDAEFDLGGNLGHEFTSSVLRVISLGLWAVRCCELALLLRAGGRREHLARFGFAALGLRLVDSRFGGPGQVARL